VRTGHESFTSSSSLLAVHVFDNFVNSVKKSAIKRDGPVFFFPGLINSRVMNEYSIGVLDDGINGFLDKWVQRHAGLESGAFALSCLLAFLMVIPAWAKICKKSNEFAKIQANRAKNSNEFAKIQVNPTKSNQIKPLFFIPTPNS
jgi:hypothetical protein